MPLVGMRIVAMCDKYIVVFHYHMLLYSSMFVVYYIDLSLVLARSHVPLAFANPSTATC